MPAQGGGPFGMEGVKGRVGARLVQVAAVKGRAEVLNAAQPEGRRFGVLIVLGWRAYQQEREAGAENHGGQPVDGQDRHAVREPGVRCCEAQPGGRKAPVEQCPRVWGAEDDLHDHESVPLDGRGQRHAQTPQRLRGRQEVRGCGAEHGALQAESAGAPFSAGRAEHLNEDHLRAQECAAGEDRAEEKRE